MVPASVAPHKDLIGRLTDCYSIELSNAGVDVILGKEATASNIEIFAPDALVVATGVNATFPDIPDLKESGAVMAVDVLQGKSKVGERVVIIGGELIACEVAEYLAARGKQVTLMRRGPEIAANVGPATRIYLMQRLKDANITMLTGVTYEGATPAGIEIETKTGEKKLIPADTIVITAGATPNASLADEMAGKAPEIYRIGDCAAPRNIAEAIRGGFVTGTMI